MSLASTSVLKAQLKSSLSANSPAYFDTLSRFISGLLSRSEFEETVRQHYLTSPHLVQLHNALIISLFDASSHQRPLTPPPDLPRKRRRMRPDDSYVHPYSARLKRWTVSVGRRERERVRSLVNNGVGRVDKGEIGSERGISVLSERGDVPGNRLPFPLATTSRSLSVQHISDRISLISAQHNLGAPSKSVAPLLALALEVYILTLYFSSLCSYIPCSRPN